MYTVMFQCRTLQILADAYEQKREASLPVLEGSVCTVMLSRAAFQVCKCSFMPCLNLSDVGSTSIKLFQHERITLCMTFF